MAQFAACPIGTFDYPVVNESNAAKAKASGYARE